MLVIRFKVTCQPSKTEHALGLFEPVIGPSRGVPGVISFDVARDIADPNSIVAVEVFEDEAAQHRQESLPEVAKVLDALPQLVSVPPEATIFHVASTDSPFAGD